MPDGHESAPARLFDHCCRVFDKMRTRSAAVQITDGGEERHALVFEGFTTRLFQELGLPTPYYTSVMRRLQEMGCIAQLTRGGGGSPSRWELMDDPNLDAFHKAEAEKRAKPSRLSQVENNVVRLTMEVDTLKKTVHDLQEKAAASG